MIYLSVRVVQLCAQVVAESSLWIYPGIYKVPLREVPRGVAQERTNARMKYLHTHLFRTIITTASTHHVKKTHPHIFEDRLHTAAVLVNGNNVGS